MLAGHTLRPVLLPLLLVFVWAVPTFCQAAISTPIWYAYGDTTYVYPGSARSIEDGETTAVPFNVDGFIEIELPRPEYTYYFASGEIFRITDTLEREYVGTTDAVTWLQEGTYEMDVFIYVLAPNRTPLQKFFAWLIPTAHAQIPGEFLETIRFTITQGPPLAPPCCSSVLFLPGIQGSALAEGDDLLWPPSAFSQDLQRLALDTAGESVNDIHVEGALGSFYGTDVYGGFASFMDDLVDEGTIDQWKPLAYDWRFPPEKILNEGIRMSGETIYPVDAVLELADYSVTGKVTIVAHSMGGLMGKALIQELEEQGYEDLIDSFVMVGTPQLGTPLGAGALLHGEQQGIGAGIFVKSHVARAVAQNMESGFNLLPSRRYFEEVSDAPITFNPSASFTEPWRNEWGTELNSYDEFRDFLVGEGVARARPNETNLAQPEVLRSELVDSADALHQAQDTYEFPSHIRVVQVAGWGRPTVKGIEYKNKHIFFEGYETKITQEGDRAVVYPSALSSDAEKYYFNLSLYNRDFSDDVEHRDLLSATPTQDLFLDVLNVSTVVTGEYISENKPPISSINDQLLVITRSPVLLGVRDSQGRFTGIDPTQDVSSDVLLVSEEIPGSTFVSFGEDQYVFLPKNGNYAFEFVGTGEGPATVEVNTFSNDTVTSVATYTDIPVTTQTNAQFTVDTDVPEETTIAVDSNGDGEVDAVVNPDGTTPDPTPTLSELIASLKLKVQELNVKDKLKNKLLKKIERLEKKIAKQKTLKASKVVMNLEKKIVKKGEKGRITDSDVEEMLNLLDQIEEAL